MKRLIIHAGLPKTGSTAVQVFLARNHAALRHQSFEYFPLGQFKQGRAGKISAGNGYLVACGLLPATHVNANKTPAAALAAMDRAIAASPCETGILSSEYFAHADLARMTSWVAHLQAAGTQVQIMYFIRAQDQALASMYVQYVKRSLCREDPDAYVERTYRDVAFLNHASFYKAQLAIFGAGNVLCRTYEASQPAVNGVCETFLAAIGADGTALPFPPETVNAGLSTAELAIMRELNKYRPHTRLSDQLIENASRAGTTPTAETYNFLAPSLTREIEAYFAAENAEMAQLCFGRTQLFERLQHSNGATRIGDYSETDVVNALGGLLVRYDERLAYLEAQLAASPFGILKRALRKLSPAALTASLASFL